MTEQHINGVNTAAPATTRRTIPMPPADQRFYQGVTAAEEVTAAHADTDFPDFQTRERMWWFFLGALAAGNHDCHTQEDFANFVSGAVLRAPKPPVDDESEED